MRSAGRRSLATLLQTIVLAAPAAAQQSTHTLRGDAVAVYNLAGTVRIERGDGPAVVAEVSRAGADAGQLRVEQGALRGRETLRILYPSDRISYEPLDRNTRTQLRVRDDGTFGDHDHRDRGDGRDRDGRRVTISGDDGGMEAWADLRIRVPAGREIAVYQAVGVVTVSNVDGRLVIDAASAPVTVSGTRGSLEVDVGSGAVSVTDAAGTVTVETGSGEVQVSRFRGDRVAVETGSGEVTASEIEAAELVVETGSGNVELAEVSAPKVSVETGSGEVTLGLRTAPKSLAVETGSGDVTLRAPGSVGAEVRIETGSGSIESGFELSIVRRSRDELIGRIGNGSGTIHIETGSGSVRLVRTGN